MNVSPTIVEVIQFMLAPGLMISACGLLLLAMNNKYSLVVNRIRLLNEERRRIILKAAGKELNWEENIRMESISRQITALTFRVKLVKNAVLSYTTAVALFVVTSLFIGFQYIFSLEKINYLVIIIFLAGMISVLTGVMFAAYESKKGYDIIQLEVKLDE
jgi:hypothetical protein